MNGVLKKQAKETGYTRLDKARRTKRQTQRERKGKLAELELEKKSNKPETKREAHKAANQLPNSGAVAEIALERGPKHRKEETRKK